MVEADIIEASPYNDRLMHILISNNNVAYKADSMQQSLAVILSLLRDKPVSERDVAGLKLPISPKLTNLITCCPMGQDFLVDLFEYRHFATSLILKGSMYEAWGNTTAHVRAVNPHHYPWRKVLIGLCCAVYYSSASRHAIQNRCTRYSGQVSQME